MELHTDRPTLHRRYTRRAPNPTVKVVRRDALLACIRAERGADARARLAAQRYEDDGWPICRHCGQSATGAYAGHIACVRCDRSHRLSALAMEGAD